MPCTPGAHQALGLREVRGRCPPSKTMQQQQWVPQLHPPAATGSINQNKKRHVVPKQRFCGRGKKRIICADAQSRNSAAASSAWCKHEVVSCPLAAGPHRMVSDWATEVQCPPIVCSN
eukprot:1160058-Pelagomonas_calceolata.AAC.14